MMNSYSYELLVMSLLTKDSDNNYHLVFYIAGGVVWRVKCNDRKLVCAVGSRNGIEDTKLFVLDFDV